MTNEQPRPITEVRSKAAPTFVVYIGESPTGGWTANLWQQKDGHPLVGPHKLAPILGIKTMQRRHTRASAERAATALLMKAALAVAKGR